MTEGTHVNTEPALIQLTTTAVNRVKEFIAKPENNQKMFRVSVKAGGCSGFEYDFGFSEKQAGDLVIPSAGIDILLDVNSVPIVQGSTIDFVDDFKGTGFAVINPNAKGSCGCGVSFTV